MTVLRGQTPSTALRALRAAVRAGIVCRGHSHLLVAVPPQMWGGRSVRIDTDAGPMVLPTDERSAAPLLLEGRVPEAAETALVSALAPGLRAMLDIGAHLGWYARIVSGLSPACRVAAFEPDAKSFRHLVASLSDRPRVACVEQCVGDRSGAATLWLGPTSNLNSTTRRVGAPRPVVMTTLDDFCAAARWPAVDFVKCDVEGGEVHVLRGARCLLAAADAPIWMLEITETFLADAGVAVDELVARLRVQAGRFYAHARGGAIVEIPHPSDRRVTNNVYFVPDRRRAEFERAAALQRPS